MKTLQLARHGVAAICCAWIALGIVVGLHAPVAAQPPQTVSPQRLQQQKQIQQQASDIARQLVGEVLDVQLQQFRDNNLTSHPWYGEIRSMRDHLDEMVQQADEGGRRHPGEGRSER